MSAGIAHELNQPLFAILNNARGCARRFEQEGNVSDEIREAIDEIAKLSKQSGEIVRCFRGFVSNKTPGRELTQVNDLVEGILKLVDHRIRQMQVIVRTDLAQDLPQLKIDRLQTQQVILNPICEYTRRDGRFWSQRSHDPHVMVAKRWCNGFNQRQ
jgi:C4-dicarboxylate-specific signal transduction histidine kinase